VTLKMEGDKRYTKFIIVPLFLFLFLVIFLFCCSIHIHHRSLSALSVLSVLLRETLGGTIGRKHGSRICIILIFFLMLFFRLTSSTRDLDLNVVVPCTRYQRPSANLLEEKDECEEGRAGVIHFMQPLYILVCLPHRTVHL
jgi:hypothetical protein